MGELIGVRIFRSNPVGAYVDPLEDAAADVTTALDVFVTARARLETAVEKFETVESEAIRTQEVYAQRADDARAQADQASLVLQRLAALTT